jgi:SAM-dependent methyltransferase
MNDYPVYWAEVLRLFDPLSVIGIDDAKGKEGESDWVMANRTDKGKWTLDRETHRFEKPERLAELDPVGTLRRFGLRDGDSVCDIGAGTGVFTFPAAALTRNNVYAVDINDEMLAAINEKIRKERTRNVIAMKGDGETLDFEDGSIDLALMVTVFHHIGDKPGMLREIRRVLTGDGRFGIIEFHDRVTPSGPPVGNRIGKMEVLGFLEEAGFEEVEGFDLGENFYAKVFRVKDSTSAHD